MPFTSEKLLKVIEQSETQLKYIQKEICEKYKDAHISIKGQKIKLNVYGKFSTSLSAAYLLSDNVKAEEPYSLIDHEVDGIKLQTKIHNPKIVRYRHFPAPVDKFLIYNAQTIFKSTDEKTEISAAEGPNTEGAAVRMLIDICHHHVETIFALGSSYDIEAPHFNYYKFAKPKKLTATINDIFYELEIKTDKVTHLTEDGYVTAYELIINLLTEQKTIFLKVINIKIKDGMTFEFDNLTTLKMIDNEIKTHHVLFHCAAGKGRTAILPLAYIMTEENLFEKDKISEYFVELFFNATKKRPALSPNSNQLNQIYSYSLLMLALRNIPLEEFPKAIFNLPEGLCQKRRIQNLYKPPEIRTPIPQPIKTNTFSGALFPAKKTDFKGGNQFGTHLYKRTNS